MKKLFVALVSLAVMFIVAVSGCAADKPQTPPAKTGDQTKPAASAEDKTEAGKQPGAGKKAEGAMHAAGATVSAPDKAETGKQTDTTKKADAGKPAAATTVVAQNKAKAKRDAEPQYRDEDILGTHTGPNGKVEQVIRPGAKPIQAGNAAKQPDIAKKHSETPAAAVDAKKETVSKKPEVESLAKKGTGAGQTAAAGQSAPSKSALAGKKRVKKAAHGKRHRKRYASRSHCRHRHARHHVRHRHAHKYARKHKHRHVKARKAKRGLKNVAAKPAAAPQEAPKLKKESKPAGAPQENKAAATPKGAK